MINIICGLLTMNNGKVFILDKDIKKECDYVKSNIGIVPQDIAIYEDLNAYENVKFFASLYGLKGEKLKQSANEALDFVGLGDKYKKLS